MIVVQNSQFPGAVRNAIVDLIPRDIARLDVASAYVTTSGCNLLFSAIRDQVGDAAFELMPKVLITSPDYGLTEPQALHLWAGLPNASVYLSGAEMLMRGSMTPHKAFHPKIYSFKRGQAPTCNTLVGSANLTGRGLSVNTEAAWAQWDVPAETVNAALSMTSSEAVLLDEALLTRYQLLRRAAPPPPSIAVELAPLPAPRIVAAEIAPLRTAIESGALEPRNFNAMWVQGEALQGGSQNQLELPRGANRFFGFNFLRYDHPHNLTIGMPVLRSGQRFWRDRPLTWHGNNRMERINLPTANRGGFDYTNKAVMFRRLADDSFELIVVPWNSDLAHSWVEASRSRGTLFRLGAVATNRLVGLL